MTPRGWKQGTINWQKSRTESSESASMLNVHFFLTLLFFGHGEMSPTILRSLMGLVYQREANEHWWHSDRKLLAVPLTQSQVACSWIRSYYSFSVKPTSQVQTAAQLSEKLTTHQPDCPRVTTWNTFKLQSLKHQISHPKQIITFESEQPTPALPYP